MRRVSLRGNSVRTLPAMELEALLVMVNAFAVFPNCERWGKQRRACCLVRAHNGPRAKNGIAAHDGAIVDFNARESQLNRSFCISMNQVRHEAHSGSEDDIVTEAKE